MPAEPPPLSASVQDLLDALSFAERRFAEWHKERRVSDKQFEEVRARYDKLRARVGSAGDVKTATLAGLPPEVPGESGAAHSLRYWIFLRDQVRRFAEKDVLRLAQSHDLLDEIGERQASLSRRLRPDEIPEVVPVAELVEDDLAPAPPLRRRTPPAEPGRSLLEHLLDPRNIQYLLAFGAALMVVGVVILLWVNDFFTPTTAAVGLGVVNAALLAAGWYVLRATRFQGAGRALTLLACLVMPLNLWYLHANGLVTLDGHLWVVGVAIALCYFASALVLRDELFVWVSCAGVTMAGLLVLAGPQQRFWEIAGPATLLVALGLVGIHLERAFPDIEGPFGRKRFGLAFFWSGHLQLAGGLLLLLGAFVAGDWLYTPIFKAVYDEFRAAPSPVVDRTQLLWLSIALVAAGTYAYVYSDLVVRHIGAYVHVAAFTLLWLMVLALEQFQIAPGVDMLIAVLAGTALVINLVQGFALKGSRYTQAFPILGVLLPLAAVSVGVIVYLRHLDPSLKAMWRTEAPSWGYLGALALAAVSCRVGAWVYGKDMPGLAAVYHFAAAAATMTGAAALLAALGLDRWEDHGPLLMLLPIVYLVAARLYRGGPNERPLVWVAHAATAVMLVASLASALEGFTAARAELPLNVMLALFFAEVALFYGLCAGLHRQVAGVHLSAAAACGAVWQLFNYFGMPGEVYTLAFALVGVALLLGYRLALTEALAGRLSRAAFQAGNVLLSLSFVSAALMGMSRLAVRQETPWPFIWLCGGLTAVGLAAVFLVRERAWRRWYVVASIGMAALTFLALVMQHRLDPWQKAELFCVSVGLLLLLAGHVGWYREQDRESDLVTLGLLFGSLLVGVPLAMATIYDRGTEKLRLYNEIGWLVAAVLLFATGFTFRLKATTVVGALLLAAYFLTLLIFVPWGKLNAVALTLTIGGGGIFLLGLVLSVFREKLLKLPERVRNREGLFRVLSWR